MTVPSVIRSSIIFTFWPVCSQQVNRGKENTIFTFAASTTCMMQSALLKYCQMLGELFPHDSDMCICTCAIHRGSSSQDRCYMSIGPGQLVRTYNSPCPMVPNRQTRCRRGILLSDHKTPRSGHDAFDMFTIASTPLMSFATCRAEIVGHALQVRQGKLASSSRANWWQRRFTVNLQKLGSSWMHGE